MDLFEYAVIRVVPRVEREEFLNVGVILYCAKQKFLKIIYKTDSKRIEALCAACDVGLIVEYLKAFEQVSNGDVNSATIGKLPAAERFRWLTATRSTMVQTSKVHPGLCADAGEMLKKLFSELVD